MSKKDDTVTAIQAAKDAFDKAKLEVDAAITEAEEGHTMSNALGSDDMATLFTQAKTDLEAVVQAAAAIDNSLNNISYGLQGGG